MIRSQKLIGQSCTITTRKQELTPASDWVHDKYDDDSSTHSRACPLVTASDTLKAAAQDEMITAGVDIRPHRRGLRQC